MNRADIERGASIRRLPGGNRMQRTMPRRDGVGDKVGLQLTTVFKATPRQAGTGSFTCSLPRTGAAALENGITATLPAMAA